MKGKRAKRIAVSCDEAFRMDYENVRLMVIVHTSGGSAKFRKAFHSAMKKYMETCGIIFRDQLNQRTREIVVKNNRIVSDSFANSANGGAKA